MTTVTLPTPQASPQTAPGNDADRPRRVGARTVDDVASLVGSAVGALALTWLLYFQILPFSGLLGFVICWYFVFLAMHAGVSALSNPRPIVIDRMMTAAIVGLASVVGIALLSTLVYVFVRGAPALTHWNFFTKDMAGVGPTASLTQGGILHAIIGSFIILTIAVVLSLPLGLGTAIFLTEVGGRFGVVVRTVVEAMTALPDLLAGLFVYVTLIIALGQEKNGLAAAVALSVTMTPIVARSAEVALRVVPGGLREAGQALGASQWATVWRVVLPTARPGLATAMILAMARGIGETAPLIIVSGASTFMNYNPLHNPMNSLPLFIYFSARDSSTLAHTRAFGAATVLLGMVLILFVVTRLLARQRVGRR